MDKKKKIALILIITVIIMTIIGATFAYWSWQTSVNEQTAVTFTVAPTFSCSADGGGNITSNEKQLIPTSCTNTNYAIQRTIKVNTTINDNNPVYLDMWLKINQIGTGLANSNNFRYALTTSDQGCDQGTVIAEGTFYGGQQNDTFNLLEDKRYSTTTTNDTYYLYIWLDTLESNSATQNQTFNIELGGECTNEGPQYVYTVNTNGSVTIGQAIPNTITQYTTPEAAMAAFGNRPFFLRHRIQNDVVSESYVGFVVTPTMARSNTGMTAGTYYLRGGIDESSLTTKPVYEANKAVLQSAFGASSGYCSEDSSIFYCGMSRLIANANASGGVLARVGWDAGCGTGSNGSGTSNCYG